MANSFLLNSYAYGVSRISPEVRAVGTVANGTGAISVPVPTGTAENDLLVVVTESTVGEPVAVPIGWSAGPNSPLNSTAGSTNLGIIYKFAGYDPENTWNTNLSTGTSGNTINAIDYGNGYWVFGASGGVIRYTTNRSSGWSGATSGTTQSINTIKYANGYWVAGASNTIIYATDPTGSWSTGATLGATAISSIFYADGYWVAVQGENIYYTTDPTSSSWSTATSGTANSLYSVSYGNGYWVAAGLSGTIRYKATDPTGSWSGATSGTTAPIRDVFYADGYWVAVGDTGVIRYKATDPTGSWSGATSGTTSALQSVFYGDGYWVSVGLSGVLQYTNTANIASWSTGGSGTVANIYEIKYANQEWTLAGASGLIKYPNITSACSIADVGDHVVGRMIGFSGVDTTTPFDTTAGVAGSGSAVTSTVISSLNTTVNNTMILAAVSTGRDAGSTTEFTFSNTTLTELTERIDNVVISGGGGGIGAVTGKLSGTSSGNITVTHTSGIINTWIGAIIGIPG